MPETILIKSNRGVKALFFCLMMVFCIDGRGLCQEGVEQAARLINQVDKLYREGRYQEAIPSAERALTIYEKAIGPDHPSVANSLGWLAYLYYSLGDYGRAEPLYQRSLSIREKALGPEHPSVATSLNNLALLYSALGDYGLAEPLYQRALAINEKALGPEHPSVATGLNNLAGLCRALGDYGRAEPLYQRALAIKEKALGSEHPSVATGLNNLAELCRALGDYGRAEPLYQRSLAINENALGPEHPSVAISLNNLALLYKTLGDYGRAEPLYQRALAINEKALGPEHPSVAISLNNLALLYKTLGDYGRAEPLYQRAMAIKEKALGPEHPSVSATQGNLGFLYLGQGQLAKAYEIFKRHAGWSNGLGRYYQLTGDLHQAEEHFRAALKHAKKTRESNPLLTAQIGLGLSLEGLAQYSEAVGQYREAVELMEEQRAGLAPAEKTHFLNGQVGADFKRIEAYEGLVRVKEKLKDSAGAFFWSEYTKARLLLDALGRGKTAPGLPKAVAQKEEALTTHLAGLYRQREKAFAKNPELFKQITEEDLPQAKAELARLVEELRRDYPVYAAIKYPQPLDASQLPLESRETLIGYEVSEDKTFGWLIRDGKVVKAVAIPITSKELIARVKKYRSFFENITSPSQLMGYDPREGYDLYKLLFKDFAAYLQKGDLVIIIPDEILGVLPFEALVVKLPAKVKMGTGKHGLYPKGVGYLSDFYAISYYQSATAFAITRTLKGTENKPGEKMLVVTDPVFELSDERLTGNETMLAEQYENQFRLMRAVSENWRQDKGPATFPRLQFTGRLAEQLTRIYGKPVDLLSRTQATEQELRSRPLTQYRYQIFATHGILDNEVPYIQEPALVLCQVGVDSQYHEQDGFLTMTEVMDLKLNAEVVALTACNTGVGKYLTGEGVMGMGRAFQYAGAKSVLMSLWSVEDESTNLLTERFFSYLKSGKNKLDALRLARTDIRKAGYEHPFFWAPFILVGER